MVVCPTAKNEKPPIFRGFFIPSEQVPKEVYSRRDNGGGNY